MGRGPCTFRESDLVRVFRGAKKAGVPVEVKISLDRKEMTIRQVEPDMTSEINEWDEEYGEN
jgi:hypothetical protein